MVPNSVDREVLIDAPRDVVWEVLTAPEHVSGWFGDIAEIDLRPGGKIAHKWEGDEGVVAEHGRVETVEPPGLFSYRWIRGADADADEGNSTLVEFTLTEEGDATRLRVIESGFAKLDMTEEGRADEAEAHSAGWKHELGELVEYVRGMERGPARP